MANLLRVILIAALAIAAISMAWPSRAATAGATNLYVSPQGTDHNGGTSPSTPLATIQAALNLAKPGTTIHLAPGTYHENPTTKVNGTPSAPISIVGTETGFTSATRNQTVLEGSGRILNVNNSYYSISGFTINGEPGLHGVTWPTTLAAIRPFKDSIQSRVVDSRLIYIGSSDTAVGVSNVHIDNMFLRGAGGECVRLRNDANHNEISNSTIEDCGLLGKGNDVTQYKYHNGEGIYLGTSPSDPSQPDGDRRRHVLQRHHRQPHRDLRVRMRRHQGERPRQRGLLEPLRIQRRAHRLRWQQPRDPRLQQHDQQQRPERQPGLRPQDRNRRPGLQRARKRHHCQQFQR